MRGDVVDLNSIFLVDIVDQGWAEVGNDTVGVSIKRDTEKAINEEKPLKLVEVNDVKGAIVNVNIWQYSKNEFDAVHTKLHYWAKYLYRIQ